MRTYKITKYTKKNICKSNLMIAKFMGLKVTNPEFGKYHNDWNWLMDVVDKINEIGATMEIRPNRSHICWWYSTRKTNFDWKEPRTTFDAIGGKHHSRCVGVGKTGNKVNCGTKIESVYNNVVYFINWYNKNVKKKKK